MNKEHCHFCQKSESKNWITEHHYLGNKGQILKESLIGDVKGEEKRRPIQTIYYCSLICMEKQMDKEEEELWNKGNCSDCQQPLAVINKRCQNSTHQKEACLYPI